MLGQTAHRRRMLHRLSKVAANPTLTRTFSSAAASSSSGPLKTFMLEFFYVPNMIERRAPHRAAHFVYAEPFLKNNILIAGGAIVPEVDRGVLLFRAADAKVVDDYAKGDPYVTGGLVTRYTIREWAVVIGKV